MTALALLFMVASWTFVLGLTAWSFRRVLRSRKRQQERPPDDEFGHAGSSGKLP